MELQISHRIHTEIPQTGNIQANLRRYRTNHTSIMQAERSGDHPGSGVKDHIHLYVAIPPKYSVSYIVGYLKGKSSLMIFDRHANLKYKYGNRHFWCRGYYVDTVGRNEKAINEYVKNQLQEDMITDQISIKEYTDPFTGEPATKGK